MDLKSEIINYPNLVAEVRMLVKRGIEAMNLSPAQAVCHAEEDYSVPYKPFEIFVVKHVAFASVALEYGVEFSPDGGDGTWWLDEFGRRYNKTKDLLAATILELGEESRAFKEGYSTIENKYGARFEDPRYKI